MPAIITSDLHLTANPRDEYRWRLFPFLAEQAQKHGAKDIYILGDLTDAKDHHSSRLVNRMVDAFHKLYQQSGAHYIHLLRANHDGIDVNCPFFMFMGKFPWLRYYATPFVGPGPGGATLAMLPHEREPAQEWAKADLQGVQLVFMHQTLAGAKSETGAVLEGLDGNILRRFHSAKIYSGDVHVPQQIGPVEYVGAPYPVRFGDSFQPRVRLLHNAHKGGDIEVPAFSKTVLTVNAAGDVLAEKGTHPLEAGFQVKVRIRLAPSEYGDWPKVKRLMQEQAKANGWDLCGIELEKAETKRRVLIKSPTPQQALPMDEVFLGHCVAQGLDEPLVEAGMNLLQP